MGLLRSTARLVRELRGAGADLDLGHPNELLLWQVLLHALPDDARQDR